MEARLAATRCISHATEPTCWVCLAWSLDKVASRHSGSPLVFLVAFLGAGVAGGLLYGDALEGTSLMEEGLPKRVDALGGVPTFEEGIGGVSLKLEALGGLSPMEVVVWEGPAMVVSSPR